MVGLLARPKNFGTAEAVPSEDFRDYGSVGAYPRQQFFLGRVFCTAEKVSAHHEMRPPVLLA